MAAPAIGMDHALGISLAQDDVLWRGFGGIGDDFGMDAVTAPGQATGDGFTARAMHTVRQTVHGYQEARACPMPRPPRYRKNRQDPADGGDGRSRAAMDDRPAIWMSAPARASRRRMTERKDLAAGCLTRLRPATRPWACASSRQCAACRLCPSAKACPSPDAVSPGCTGRWPVARPGASFCFFRESFCAAMRRKLPPRRARGATQGARVFHPGSLAASARAWRNERRCGARGLCLVAFVPVHGAAPMSYGLDAS